MEDIDRGAWWAPAAYGARGELPLSDAAEVAERRLAGAVEASGARTLAEACQHPAVLDVLLSRRKGLNLHL